MIKAIIFDFDGTISNRQRNAYNVFKDYMRPFFKDCSDLEYEAVLQDMLTDDCNGTIKTTYRFAPFIAKYQDNLPEDWFEKFNQFYYDYMWKYVELKKETIETLEKLKGKYKLAIFSNGVSKSQHDKIDNCKINEYFEEIIVSGDIGISKPKKEAFDYMADKLGVKNEECIFVGDVFSNDIIGAINAGMTPVWIITDEERPYDFYKGLVIHKINELVDVVDNLK